MARHGLKEEQAYTTKLLILTSMIALVTIIAVNQSLGSGSITGATTYSGGGAVGLMVLIIGMICVIMLLHKENIRYRGRRR
jgi:hypothetical protein